MTVFLSNRLEHLAKDLKENLFANSSFFSKRILIFPNGAIKEFIYQYLADDPQLKVAFGITPFYLDEAIEYLTDKFFISNIKKKPLSQLQLVFKIEEHFDGSFAACQSLAFLFERYGKYGPCQEMQQDKMQEELWNKVFANHSYLAEILNNLTEKKTIDTNYSVHIFGFNELAPIHFSFFHRLANKIPLYFYHLSPCQEFWTDIRSDKEAKRFFSKVTLKEKLQITFEEYLEDRHPLLANLGKVGREFAKLVEESELPTVEKYEDPKDDTELHSLQREILFLKEKEKKIFKDESIQIHILTTCHREIENLYNILCSLIHEKGIEPKDILVMAPDITKYAPYISACFEKIPFRICDMPIVTLENGILGLFQLIDLEEKRWNAGSVMSLFSHPLFQKKQNWRVEDLNHIRNWIDKGTIRWGVNLEHVNALLTKEHCKTPLNDDNATWEAGLKRLYKNFALFEEASNMNIVESELLGEMSFLINALYKDTRPFYDSTEKPLQDWIEYLKTIYITYFAEDDPDILFSKLDIIKKSGFNKKYPFLKLWPLVRDVLSKEKITINRHQLQSVTFCSMMPTRSLPSKVIYLLGMQHDAFPRKQRLSSFDVLKKENKYCPTITDTDRYLFLEALLSARDYFFISYIGKSLQDQIPIPESSVVFELLRASECRNVVIHPDVTFDPLYFQNKNSILKNYSQKDYSAALSLFDTKKQLRTLLIKQDPFPLIPEGEHIIDIQELKRACRYPVSYFLEKNLKLSFFEEKETKEEEDFLLSPWILGNSRKKVLKSSANAALKMLEEKGIAPLGTFKNLALLRLQKEEMNKAFFKTINSIEFSLQYRESRFEANVGWKKPAIIFPYDEKRKIIFVGTLENVTEKGLFTNDRCQIDAAVKHWSDFLLLNLALNTPQEIFFGKDKKERSPFFEDGKPFLKRLVDYFFYAKSQPLFLLPEWVEAILKRDLPKLGSLIEEKKTYDKGAIFASRSLSEHEIIDNCSELCDNLYKDMSDAWF